VGAGGRREEILYSQDRIYCRGGGGEAVTDNQEVRSVRAMREEEKEL
jgi:hypothetical protein